MRSKLSNDRGSGFNYSLFPLIFSLLSNKRTRHYPLLGCLSATEGCEVSARLTCCRAPSRADEPKDEKVRRGERRRAERRRTAGKALREARESGTGRAERAGRFHCQSKLIIVITQKTVEPAWGLCLPSYLASPYPPFSRFFFDTPFFSLLPLPQSLPHSLPRVSFLVSSGHHRFPLRLHPSFLNVSLA